jgi:hypothetical protein
MSQTRLTARQQLFVENYVIALNALGDHLGIVDPE